MYVKIDFGYLELKMQWGESRSWKWQYWCLLQALQHVSLEEGAPTSSHVREESGYSILLLASYQIPLHSHSTLFPHVIIIKRKPLLSPLLSSLILFHLLLQVHFLETKSYIPKERGSSFKQVQSEKQYLPRSWSCMIDLPIKAKSENEICS